MYGIPVLPPPDHPLSVALLCSACGVVGLGVGRVAAWWVRLLPGALLLWIGYYLVTELRLTGTWMFSLAAFFYGMGVFAGLNKRDDEQSESSINVLDLKIMFVGGFLQTFAILTW